MMPCKKNEKNFLVMEEIPFPSLEELYIHWDLGPNTWDAIFKRLNYIREDITSSLPKYKGSSSWLYSQKLRNRWNAFVLQSKKAMKTDCHWFQKDLCINGKSYKALEKQVDDLLAILPEYEVNSDLHMIHGDLCFNNILCEPSHISIRLIDPRGEQDKQACLPVGYGDSRYDLAKLFHSIEGCYDSIVNNLFRIRWQSSSDIDLDVYEPALKSYLVDSFCHLIKPEELNKKELYLLTSSLFLSMLPLHSDNPERQMALGIEGMKLLQKI